MNSPVARIIRNVGPEYSSPQNKKTHPSSNLKCTDKPHIWLFNSAHQQRALPAARRTGTPSLCRPGRSA
ncbi:hypothetical protein SBA4_3400021 [Candidatus Sulfopaludibacter sp. SbA4]|nr:hypothetical protein SBA4_3400021 [Candidatus Sulfopaludibacter sp. SbA4]